MTMQTQLDMFASMPRQAPTIDALRRHLDLLEKDATADLLVFFDRDYSLWTPFDRDDERGQEIAATLNALQARLDMLEGCAG